MKTAEACAGLFLRCCGAALEAALKPVRPEAPGAPSTSRACALALLRRPSAPAKDCRIDETPPPRLRTIGAAARQH